jgi:hypothetical protein
VEEKAALEEIKKAAKEAGKAKSPQCDPLSYERDSLQVCRTANFKMIVIGVFEVN